MSKSFNQPGLTVNEARLTYTIDNEFEYDRSEVVGIHALFPEGATNPADVYNVHFRAHELCQVVGYGHKFENGYQTTRFVTTLFNPDTGVVGDLITPGSLRIEYQAQSGGYKTIVDDGAGGFTDPEGLLDLGTINYTTGDIELRFAWNERPITWFEKHVGGKVFAYWTPVTQINYPTQWTVTRTWPNGTIKQAKAWIGRENGDPLFIPAATNIDMYAKNNVNSAFVQVSSGGSYTSNVWDGTSSPAGLLNSLEQAGILRSGGVNIHRLWGTNRIIVRQHDAGNTTYNTTNLPVYTVNTELSTKLASQNSMRSDVRDNSWNNYRVSMWDTNPHEENVLENPDFGGSNNQGWMRVTQRRQYHEPLGNTSNEARRDLTSLTSYTYIPHNSRMAQVECRVANDYRGHDPYAHQFTESVPTYSGSTSVALTHCHNGVWSGATDAYTTDFPCIKQCNVEFLDNEGNVVAADFYGDGFIISVSVDGIPQWSRFRENLESPNERWGFVDYETGDVTIYASAPGQVSDIRYKSYVQRVGSVNGTNPSSQVFDSLPQGTDPSQYSLRVRVGKTSILAEGWDAGGQKDTQTGYLAPFLADEVTHHDEVITGSVATTQAFNIGTNIHPGSVKVYLSEYACASRNGGVRTSTWSAPTVFVDDDGNGGRGHNRNVDAFSINYTTGACSVTFSSAPGVAENLYVSYRRDTSTVPVSGSWDRDGGANSHGQLTLNLQGSFTNDDVYISYFPNKLRSRGFYHDPNVHALGHCSFAHWQINYDADLQVHMEGTDWAYFDRWLATSPSSGESFPSSATGSKQTRSIYRYYQGFSGGSPRSIRAWDARYDRASTAGSGGDTGAYGYLADGSSLYRNFFVYANNSATTADDDAWAAKRRAHVHGIPTIACQTDTEALTVFQATWQRVSPATGGTFGAKRFTSGASWDPDSMIYGNASISERDGWFGMVQETIVQAASGNVISLIDYGTRAGEGRTRYEDLWEHGRGSNPADLNGSSIRPDLRWFENKKTGTSAAGAPRINHCLISNILFTGSNSGARFLTHAGMFNLTRSGMATWGSPDSFTYREDLYRNYTGQDSPDGKLGGMQSIHPVWRLSQSAVGATYTTSSLRGRGKGRVFGFEREYFGGENNLTNVRVVESSNGTVIRAYWNVFSGSLLYDPPGDATPLTYDYSSDPLGNGSTFFGFRFPSLLGGGEWSSWQGNDHSNLMTKCTIAGSDVYHNLKSATYNSSGGYTEFVIDPPYPASPSYSDGVSSPLAWTLCSDYREGKELPWVRNDPRTFPQLRNGIYTNSDQQSGIEGEVTTHQAHYAGYDAWTLTGEWSVWDQIKFHADWAMLDIKDIQTFSGSPIDHYEGQQRANMWNMRNVVQAYDATHYLNEQPAFSFLNDLDSGLRSKDRYRSYIVERIRAYVDSGMTGVMDPNGNIATGRRSKIANITFDKAAPAADWDNLANLGTKQPPYGDGTLTEGQIVYGQGYNYLSAWELGYGHPYFGAAFRYFENDPELRTLNVRRNRPSTTTVGEILFDYWDAFSRLMVGWTFIDRGCNVVTRSAPGFVRVSRSSTSLTVEPVSNANRFATFPEEIGGPDEGVREASPQQGEGFLNYNVVGGFSNQARHYFNISPVPTQFNLSSVSPCVLYDVAANPQNYGMVANQSVSFQTLTSWNLNLSNLLLPILNEAVPVSSFPSKVFNRHYISSQVYWLRAAPRRVTNAAEALVDSPSKGDRIGHPIVNQKGEEITIYGNDSTFDAIDTHFPDDTVNDPVDWPPTAWHFGGEAGWGGSQTPTNTNEGSPGRLFDGGSELPGIPQSEFTGIGSVTHPSTRPPKHAEAVCVLGNSSYIGSAFLVVAYAGLPTVAKYHPDPYIAARAGDLLNRLVYNGIVMASIQEERISNGEPEKLLALEDSVTAGGVTGGFPWEDNPQNINNGGGSGIATDRWSQAGYARRRAITSSALTVSATDDDVFVLDFSSLSIPVTELLDATLRDAVVVIQRSDGSELICDSLVIDVDGAAGGNDYKMFIRFPESIASGSSIGGNTAVERWYLYTTSTTGPFPSWSNESNIDAPLATDTATVMHWDDSAIDGNAQAWRDTGPNNWAGSNIAGLTASASLGRHRPGWTLTPTSGSPFLGIFNTRALDFAASENVNYLGNDFAFDLSYKITVQDMIALHGQGGVAATQNYGLISTVQESVTQGNTYSFLAYLELNTGAFKINYGGATSADALITSGRTQITAQGTLDTGTDYILSFSPARDINKPYWVGDSTGTVRAKLDPNGQVITNYGINTVDAVDTWAAGDVTVTLNSAPSGGVYGIYFEDSTPNDVDNTIFPEEWFNIRFDHTGSFASLYLNDSNVGGVVNSTPFPSFFATTASNGFDDALSVGALYSTNTFFVAPARGLIADFRVSNQTRGALISTSTSLQDAMSLPSVPETLFNQHTADLTVAGDVKAPLTSNLSAQANVVRVRGGSVSAAGDMVRRPISDLSSAGNVAGVSTARVNVSGLVETTKSHNLGVTGNLITTETSTLSGAGTVSGVETASLSSVGSVSATKSTEPVFALGYVSGVGAHTLSGGGYLVLPRESSFTAAGSVQSHETSTLSAEGSVQYQPPSPFFNVFGYLKTPAEESKVTGEGWVVTQQSSTLSAVGEVAPNVTASLTSDGYVILIRESNLSGSGGVAGVNTASFSSFGFVEQQGLTVSFSADGMVQATPIHELTASGTFQATFVGDLMAGGLVQATGSSSMSAEGNIQSTETSDLTAEGSIQYQTTATLSGQGRLTAPTFVEGINCSGSIMLQGVTATLSAAGNISTPDSASFTAAGYIDVEFSNSAWLAAAGSVSVFNTETLLGVGLVKEPQTRLLYCFGYITGTTGLVGGSNGGVSGGSN